jgi:hypothetical protein
MSKSLTLNCQGCVDYRLHLGFFNEQYRAPIHKIQHVFAGTVYGVLDSTGTVGELSGYSNFNDNMLLFITTDKGNFGNYPKEIQINDRFILTNQTNPRWNGVFEATMDFAPQWQNIDTNGIDYFVVGFRKMCIGGCHIKQFYTANAELTNAALSEDGLILRHNTVEPKQGDDTFGGMKIEDFNKDFVVTIEMQTDVRQNGVYEINTTDDFHGTYREFHRLPYAEYDGHNRDPAAYQSTWCGMNVVTDVGEYWQGQSLHSEDFALDADGESVMNVDWKRGSGAYWVLNPDNNDNGRFYGINVQHTLEGLNADIEYTEDKENIILTGNQNIDEYHTGGEFVNDDVAMVRNCGAFIFALKPHQPTDLTQIGQLLQAGDPRRAFLLFCQAWPASLAAAPRLLRPRVTV